MLTIKADWLKACGYKSDGNRVFRVLETMPGRLPDRSRMFVVDFNGRPWTVAEWRCEAVNV